MAGTREGGLKAAATIRRKKGKGFYAKIGRKGGKAEVEKGFSMNRELASIAGSRGARKQRTPRRPARQPVPRIRRIHVHYMQ